MTDPNPTGPASPDGLIVLGSAGGRHLYDQVDQLRAAAPAVQVQLPGGLTAWSVTRGAVVKELLTDPRVSKNPGNWAGYRPGAYPWLAGLVDVESMLTADGADHARLRKLVSHAFTARRVQAMTGRIQAIVDELLADLDTVAPGEETDLRAAYTYPVPTRVIADLFGVPDDQRPQMLAAIDAVLNTSRSAADAERDRGALWQAMHNLVESKLAGPGEDMTSALLTLRDSGERLTEEELISTLILMIGAGSETTVAALDHTVVELAKHPLLLAAVLDDPQRWPEAIEEALRLHPPIVHFPMRFATDDIPLGEGVLIGKGEPILLGFGAHGRDPAVHLAAETYSLSRTDRQHLAFGHGIHHCLGAPLARLETDIALRSLFSRFPRLHLATGPDQLTRVPSFIGNDYQALPVILTPA